mmetsp:Transcript_17959/g.39868  ORF Transcript_17959/g.39868 Transcript_17959/m.39868 type:complete len:336 (+) Transcript_17959:1989-2996(+)
MRTTFCTILGLVAASAAAFAPAATFAPRTVTSLRAEKTELVVDENFDDVNLVGLLGLNRLKKISRKHKRQLVDRIQNFEVVQDGEDYVPATAEQSEQMRDAAGVAAPAVHRAAAVGKAVPDPLKIIIAGAPASGKGTQCEMIKEQYGVVHLSTGDMLRAAVADQTEVGKLAKEYMDSGKLVPDDVIIGVVKDRLDQTDCQKRGWLLDGFPRTPAQADALAAAGVSADCFLFLNVPDEVLVERVVGRRTDPETGKIYHMTFSPPDDEEVLARLEQRSDDTEEKVKVRLEQFHANVDAVKGSYTDISVDIDGTASPSDVAKSVDEGIKSKATAKAST